MTSETNTQNNRVALVTGASRGIGKGIARALAAQNYNIAFCYRSNRQAAMAFAHELEEMGVSALPIEADMANNEDISAMFAELKERFDRLDLLVNNAGITQDGLLVTMSDEELMSVIQVNLIGTMLCSREAVKIMMTQRHGNIINISSISASKPNRGQSNYAASKGGVEAFTRALAVEVAKKRIRVNAIAPGVIQTDMVDDLLVANEEALRKKLLSKRLGNTDDISKAVLYLADPENDYVTGEILHVNGGIQLL